MTHCRNTVPAKAAACAESAALLNDLSFVRRGLTENG